MKKMMQRVISLVMALTVVLSATMMTQGIVSGDQGEESVAPQNNLGVDAPGIDGRD